MAVLVRAEQVQQPAFQAAFMLVVVIMIIVIVVIFVVVVFVEVLLAHCGSRVSQSIDHQIEAVYTADILGM